MATFRLAAGILAGLLMATLSGEPAGAANLLELNFWLSGPKYDGVMPPCDEPAVASRITTQFDIKESRFWNSELTILGLERVRETAYRPWAPNDIPRRYCSAVALISDGSKRPIHYSIGEDTGMIGAHWGVEWCVVGLDRNWAYNPRCQWARP